MVSLSDYLGREQSYVKHVFLESYLERLVHKTASKYPHIVYVDGFAGPWQSANERFEDTSFCIAINALRRAKASWKTYGRHVRMSAFLVERDAVAYAKLSNIPAQFPDIEIQTYNDDFMNISGAILSSIPHDAFAFFLLDPKGWRISLRQLAPLLARPNSEVIFNFMFDFINRAASIKDANVVAGLDELIPFGDWRVKLKAAEKSNSTEPAARKQILAEAFAESLKQLGSYEYVAETTVLRPVKDRPLYCLFYATRHPKGIGVFRDCQFEALRAMSKTRAVTKVKHAAQASGQGEIFESLHDMAPDSLDAFFEDERRNCEATLLSLVPPDLTFIHYEALLAQVQARHVVRAPDVNKLAARLRKDGMLFFPEWEPRKQVPDLSYRVQKVQPNNRSGNGTLL